MVMLMDLHSQPAQNEELVPRHLHSKITSFLALRYEKKQHMKTIMSPFYSRTNSFGNLNLTNFCLTIQHNDSQSIPIIVSKSTISDSIKLAIVSQ